MHALRPSTMNNLSRVSGVLPSTKEEETEKQGSLKVPAAAAAPAGAQSASSEDKSSGYRDYAHDMPPTFAKIPQADGGIPFPLVLYNILNQVEQDGFAHVISWQVHGRCFIVHKQQKIEEVLSFYTKQTTKWKSFLRQLRGYGFQRLTQGRDKGGFYHEKFLRGRDFLATLVVRHSSSSGQRQMKMQEPDLWSYPFVKPLPVPPESQASQQKQVAALRGSPVTSSTAQESSTAFSSSQFGDIAGLDSSLDTSVIAASNGGMLAGQESAPLSRPPSAATIDSRLINPSPFAASSSSVTDPPHPIASLGNSGFVNAPSASQALYLQQQNANAAFAAPDSNMRTMMQNNYMIMGFGRSGIDGNTGTMQGMSQQSASQSNPVGHVKKSEQAPTISHEHVQERVVEHQGLSSIMPPQQAHSNQSPDQHHRREGTASSGAVAQACNSSETSGHNSGHSLGTWAPRFYPLQQEEQDDSVASDDSFWE